MPSTTLCEISDLSELSMFMYIFKYITHFSIISKQQTASKDIKDLIESSSSTFGNKW